jgi:hypothetical protein
MTADTEQTEAPKVSKNILKTADRYLSRMKRGEKILRDSRGQLQWASGKPVGSKTIQHLLSEGRISELDTDLFGDRSRGQTLGLAS